MTISYRRQQSQTGSSEEPEGEGYVYFIETEAEEIFQMADHQTTQGAEATGQPRVDTEQFVFQDNEDHESVQVITEPNTSSQPANNSIQNDDRDSFATEIEATTRRAD